MKRFDLIREWAKEKGIYKKGDSKTQTLKLVEEAGELAKAVLNDNQNEVIDAIGDCVVVLTNLASSSTASTPYFIPFPNKLIIQSYL